MKFIKQVSGKPGSGQATTVFKNGAVTKDLVCAQFFMKMQDEDKSLEDARSYAHIGPMIAPDVNVGAWAEINRILDTFGGPR